VQKLSRVESITKINWLSSPTAATIWNRVIICRVNVLKYQLRVTRKHIKHLLKDCQLFSTRQLVMTFFRECNVLFPLQPK